MRYLFLLVTTIFSIMTNAQNNEKFVPLLTSDIVLKIVTAAKMEAEKDNLTVTITVVDRSGQTLAVFKLDNLIPISQETPITTDTVEPDILIIIYANTLYLANPVIF